MNKVLVIEDTQDNFDLLADALDGQFGLVHARTGNEGLCRARSEKPDVILLDMMLPEMDGWEVSRCIRADPILQHVPIIALTAQAMRGDREQCLTAGCDEYRASPISVSEIRLLVHDFVSGVRLHGAAAGQLERKAEAPARGSERAGTAGESEKLYHDSERPSQDPCCRRPS